MIVKQNFDIDPFVREVGIQFSVVPKTILSENGPKSQSASNCWDTSNTSFVACIRQEERAIFSENQIKNCRRLRSVKIDFCVV